MKPDEATGTQYFHLCKILLHLYRPDIPSPGAGLQYSRVHREMKVCVEKPPENQYITMQIPQKPDTEP